MSVVTPQCAQTQTKSDQSDHTTSTADPEVPRVGTIIDRLRGLLYTEPDTLQIWGPPGGLWASWPLGSPGGLWASFLMGSRHMAPLRVQWGFGAGQLQKAKNHNF